MDREDEEWVAVQKKGFSRWANSYLRKRRLEVRASLRRWLCLRVFTFALLLHRLTMHTRTLPTAFS
jgi:hypothetical protein